MAKKKRNKKEQTFNVYPYLGGYQHFMRSGGSLPKFEVQGAADASTIQNRIKPHNKYAYANNYDGVVDEWRAANDPNYIPRGSMMGDLANTISSTIDFGKSVGDVFDKDNYKPGGKWSKHQTTITPGTPASCNNAEYTTKEECEENNAIWTEATESREDYAGLKYANQSITNTTDETAILDGESLEIYNNMSKKEKAEFMAKGGRNSDLFRSQESMMHGDWNYLKTNEDGTPTYDGINLQASTMRANALEEQTGDRMFSNKTKVLQDDGTYKFVYFDKKGNLLADQSKTEYDEIEEGNAAGQLGDANATQMNIEYQSEEALLNIPGVVMGPDGYPINGETGERVTSKNQLKSFDHYAKNKDTDEIVHNKNVKYDKDKEYGDYSTVKKHESSQQKVNECEMGHTCGGDPGIWIPDETGGFCDCNRAIKYGSEILNKFVYGGALPKYQDVGQTTEGQVLNCPPPEEGCPEGQVWDGKACTCMLDNTNPQAVIDANDQMRTDDAEAAYQADPAVIQKRYDDVGLVNPLLARGDAGEFTCSDGVSTTIEECEANGGKWDDPTNMGIETSYGDGPLQTLWNKGSEALNTGPFGAIKDTIVGQSAEQYCSDPQYKTKEACEKEGEKWTDQKGTGAVSLLFDNLMPLAKNIMGQNAERKNDMHKRSVSSSDLYAAAESGVGAGQRGFHDINKGGLGDDLYGTGKIFGTAQQGQELMPQQPQRDLSGVPAFMNQNNNVAFDLEFLRRQKSYLGKMNMGGHLPKFQGTLNTGETTEEFIADGKEKINAGHYVEPSSNSQEGLNYGNSRVSSETYGSTNTESVNGENTNFQDDFVSNFNIENAAGADNVVVNRSAIGKLFNKGNVKVANTNKRRDVRKIQDKYGMSPEELVATGEYTMNENGELVSTANRASSWAHSSNEGGWKNGSFKESFGSFTHPNAANNNQGSFATSLTDNQDMSYDESSKTYWDNIGQYSTGEDNIYSNPDNAGSFLPEVEVTGRYGGHLPKLGPGDEVESVANADGTFKLSDLENKDGAYTDQSWFTKANHGFSESMYNTSQKTNALEAPAFGKIGKVIKTDKIVDFAKSGVNAISDWWNKDKKIAGPPEGNQVINTAKHGGEHEAEIDMDLYYELMQAGADMKIIR